MSSEVKREILGAVAHALEPKNVHRLGGRLDGPTWNHLHQCELGAYEGLLPAAMEPGQTLAVVVHEGTRADFDGHLCAAGGFHSIGGAKMVGFFEVLAVNRNGEMSVATVRVRNLWVADCVTCEEAQRFLSGMDSEDKSCELAATQDTSVAA